MNKQQVQSVMARIRECCPELMGVIGTVCGEPYRNPKKHFGHPIYLNVVLKLIAEQYRDDEFPKEKGLEQHVFEYSLVPKLCALWSKCGLLKSLDEIVEESGWEQYRNAKPPMLKSPEAKALFEFLESILITKDE